MDVMKYLFGVVGNASLVSEELSNQFQINASVVGNNILVQDASDAEIVMNNIGLYNHMIYPLTGCLDGDWMCESGRWHCDDEIWSCKSYSEVWVLVVFLALLMVLACAWVIKIYKRPARIGVAIVTEESEINTSDSSSEPDMSSLSSSESSTIPPLPLSDHNPFKALIEAEKMADEDNNRV